MKYSAYIPLYLDNFEGCVIAATGISAILTACAPAVFALCAKPRVETLVHARRAGLFTMPVGCAVLRS